MFFRQTISDITKIHQVMNNRGFINQENAFNEFVFANFNTAVSINYKNCCCINIYRYSAFCVVCHVSYCSLWYWVSFFLFIPPGA